MAAPVNAQLFVFNVGFGDCFLLRFIYPDASHRHVLIDFGSTRAPPVHSSDSDNPNAALVEMDRHMVAVAEKIKELCGGALDVLVATHRHKDHISGFSTKNGKGSGDIIASLNPKLVLQPWTEDPDAAIDAKVPQSQAAAHAFKKSLSSMNGFAASLETFAASLDDVKMKALGLSPLERSHLQFIGENNVANAKAVKNLVEMGKKTSAHFLHADNPLDISKLLPGVKAHVLGPPTIAQCAGVAKQAEKNPDEYWHLMAADIETVGQYWKTLGGDVGDKAQAKPRPLFKGFTAPLPPYARWAKAKLAGLRKDMLFGITTALDKAMNNTSLILLFEVGGKSLLFPGDAQWENWQYALSQPKYVSMLKSVDLYKVGHHGSLNATPKSLWKLFEQKSETAGKKGRLVSVMSTKAHVHGESPETAVPRSTLVGELRSHSDFHSTQSTEAAALFEVIEIPL
jgi:hypothetical protein